MKNKKISKRVRMFIILFLLINTVCMSPVFGVNTVSGPQTKIGATILQILITSSQIIVTGWFAIRFSLEGIRYFTAVSAEEKAAKKTGLVRILCYGVLAYLLVFLFSAAVGVA